MNFKILALFLVVLEIDVFQCHADNVIQQEIITKLVELEVRNQITELKTEIRQDVRETVQKEISAIKKSLGTEIPKEVQNKVDGVFQHVNQRIDQLSTEWQMRNQGIAFTAYPEDGEISVDHEETVPFNRIITNIGGHYSTLTRRFTCPIDGVFFFSVCVNNGPIYFGNPPDRSELVLMIDGEPVVEVFSFNGDLSALIVDQACNTVITACSEGSQVWVESQYYGSPIYGTSGDIPRSTFSGFFLYPL